MRVRWKHQREVESAAKHNQFVSFGRVIRIVQTTILLWLARSSVSRHLWLRRRNLVNFICVQYVFSSFLSRKIQIGENDASLSGAL